MHSARVTVLSMLSCLRPRSTEADDVNMRVLNLTRNTQLASNAQLAGNGRNRRKGLLGRESLPEGEGLWIIPSEAVHTFGMRFPIDLVYLDRRHRVVKTRSHVRPWRLSGSLRAHSVLELPAGTILQTETMPGDALTLERTN
jgi:uncharacterized protein